MIICIYLPFLDTFISYVNWLTRTTVEIYTVKFKASSFCFVACTTHISETLSYFIIIKYVQKFQYLITKNVYNLHFLAVPKTSRIY